MRKKSGLISLFIYIALFLGYGISALVCYIRAENNMYEGWEGLGIALLMIIFMIFAAVAGVAMLLKIVHVAAGWGVFGFLCTLNDFAALAFLIFYVVDGSAGEVSLDLLEGWYILLPIPALLVSFPANIKSLGR